MIQPVVSINQESNAVLKNPTSRISSNPLYDHVLSNSTQSVKNKLVHTVPWDLCSWNDAVNTDANTLYNRHSKVVYLNTIQHS